MALFVMPMIQYVVLEQCISPSVPAAPHDWSHLMQGTQVCYYYSLRLQAIHSK